MFSITGRSMNNGIPQYTVQDYSGTTIKGKFYQSQLLKAYPSNTFLIDRVIGRRKRLGIEEVLIKWKGWDKQRWLYGVRVSHSAQRGSRLSKGHTRLEIKFA